MTEVSQTAAPADRPAAGFAGSLRGGVFFPRITERLHAVLSKDDESSTEVARAIVHWVTTVLPEVRSLIAVQGARVEVLAADSTLKSVRDEAFVAGIAGLLGAAGPRLAMEVPAALRAHPAWAAELGERRSRVARLGLPRVAQDATLVLFHSTDFAGVVEDALAALTSLLASAVHGPPPDPKVYAVVSKAKHEWERTVDALDQLVLLVDRRGTVLRANRTVERWGLGAVSSVCGSAIHDVLHPQCKELSCRLARLLTCRWKQVRAQGSTSFELFDNQLDKTLQLTLQPMLETGRPPEQPDTAFGVVVVKDISELHQTQRKLRQLNEELELRVRLRTQEVQDSNYELREEIARREVAEQELHGSRDELARLSAQLLDAQEAERRRIALELHDSVGQALGALKYSLERFIAISKNPQLGDPEQVLDAAIKQLQTAINDTRTISMSLRPSLLDDMGAVSAIKWLCRWFGETYVDIHVITVCKVDDSQIPERLAAPIFRIVQEALSNVAKHARARNVLVMLRRRAADLTLEVRDDGVGFDPQGGAQQPSGLGIVGMRERATMTGGRFRVISGKDVSTQVRVEWDLAT